MLGAAAGVALTLGAIGALRPGALVPGHGARAGGVALPVDGASLLDIGSGADGGDGPSGASAAGLLEANARLVTDIVAYRRRLEAIEAERRDLAQKLVADEARLGALTDGGARMPRSDFDLTPADWADLATRGELRFRVPCQKKVPWSPSPEELHALGLRPDDAAVIRDIYRRSNERLWAAVKPACARILGSAELAERLGAHPCARIITDGAPEDMDIAKATARRVAEVRAGSRPPPRSDDLPASEAYLLAMTAESERFESDLAASFGPEDAHRLAYADEMCAEASWLGGHH